MDGAVWIVSYVLLWLAVLVLAVTVVALLRQIGVLHTRLRPMGVHFAGEGPERLTPAPMADRFDYRSTDVSLVAFTSDGCSICAGLMPGLQALAQEYDELALYIVSHDLSTAPVFSAFNVASTPYFVAVDRAGTVQVRGVANSLEQIEVMIDEALAHEPTAQGTTEGVSGGTQR